MRFLCVTIYISALKVRFGHFKKIIIPLPAAEWFIIPTLSWQEVFQKYRTQPETLPIFH